MADWYRKENGEIDREKVIDELERDLVREPDEQTHIIGTFDREAVECALELLKAQEPAHVQYRKMNIGKWALTICGNCKEQLREDWKFCPICGKAVKWK